MLIDHRLCTVSTQQEPLHTHSLVCGHEELFKAPVCSLANCFEGFTIHKGNCYLMSFHDIGRDLETKSVYSKQGYRPHPLPSHPVCLQTDHFSITGCTILASFTLINYQLQTPHSYFSLKRALQLHLLLGTSCFCDNKFYKLARTEISLSFSHIQILEAAPQSCQASSQVPTLHRRGLQQRMSRSPQPSSSFLVGSSKILFSVSPHVTI